MTIPATATRAIFDEALNAAAEIGTKRLPNGLNADLFAGLRGQLEAAWDEIVGVLDKAFTYGKQQSQALLQESISRIEQLLKEAGARARELQDALMQKLREFLRRFLQGVLSLMPPTMMIGSGSMMLDKMSYTQRIKLGGSLEASLTSICELVAEGELEVAFEYTAGTPPAAGA